MENLTEEQAIEVLKKHAPDNALFEKVLKHSKKVQEISLRIADKIKRADKEFIRTASLLHDIGRFQFPPGASSVLHGIKGAEILREEGLEKYALVAERHLGVGITKDDIAEQNLDLPEKNYVPKSVEEKIITYADNLVFGDKEGTLEQVKERFRRELGEKYAERVEKLRLELERLKNQ